MNKLICAILVLVLSTFASPAMAANKKPRTWTPQEIQADKDRRCQESDLTFEKETQAFWDEYKKACGVRPANLAKFEKVAGEYEKQCSSRPNGDKAPAAFLKCELAEDQLRSSYLTLYELERQQLFATKAATMRGLVKTGCPQRANAKNLRHAFARCHIHIMGVDRDGYNHWRDSLPKSAHQQLETYKASLKQRGLWTEE